MTIMVRWLGLVAAAVLLAAAAWVPMPTAADQTTGHFDVVPGQRPVACPGALTVPVGDIDPGDPDIAPVAPGTDYRVVSDEQGTAFEEGDGTWFASMAASVWERVESGDIASIASMACTAPRTSQWLVAGSTAIGSSARLVLSNPVRTPVDVTVTLYGPVGQVEQRAVVIVAPFGQTEVLLEAVEVGMPALVVHVEASGSGVAAALQDSRLDGIQAAGTDWVTPVDHSGQDLVIPVVGAEGENHQTTVRLMSPEGATVTLALVGEDGRQPWGGTARLILEPGVVVDVAAPELTTGSILITADAPVMAAARTVIERPATEGLEGDVSHDHAWISAVEVDSGGRALAVPATPAQLWVYSPTAQEVTFTDGAGQPVATVSVEADSVTRIDLAVPRGTVLTNDQAVAWAVVYAQQPGFMSVLQPVSTVREAVRISVTERLYFPR